MSQTTKQVAGTFNAIVTIGEEVARCVELAGCDRFDAVTAEVYSIVSGERAAGLLHLPLEAETETRFIMRITAAELAALGTGVFGLRISSAARRLTDGWIEVRP